MAYAPLAENLRKALAEYTETDQASKPVGKQRRRGGRARAHLLAEIDSAARRVRLARPCSTGDAEPLARRPRAGLAN